MSINDLLQKVKPFYNLILILVIASIFFALGRLSVLEERHVPIKIGYPNSSETAMVLAGVGTKTPENATPLSEDQSSSGEARLLPLQEGGQVIGSKNGKKYYFPWCGTVKMIKPENQIKFSSIEEARKAGYLPAANCKGLK